MRKKLLYFMSFKKNNEILLVALAILLLPPSVSAEVTSVDPSLPPAVTLPPVEAQKLVALQQTTFPNLYSPVSPNGKFVFTLTPNVGPTILNTKTNTTVTIDPEIYNLNRLTEIRWLQNRALTCIVMNQDGSYSQVKINRRTGKITFTPLDLPGYPLSLSNKGKKVLLVRQIETTSEDSNTQRQLKSPQAPIKHVTIPTGFSRPGPAEFAYEESLTVPVATINLSSFIFDLATGKETPLLTVDEETALMAISWSPKDSQIATIRWKEIDHSRGGQLTEDSPEVQDALGQLPPEENPYFTENKVDIFHFTKDQVKHHQIQPKAEDKAIISDINWAPNGNFFVAKMWNATTLEGRTYPSYINSNSSSYRFYWRNGKQIGNLDRPEISSLVGMAHAISSCEVLIHAPYKMDFTVFRYNLFTQKLTQLPIPEGSIYQVTVSPRTKEIIYNYSSYQQPYELFRFKLNRKKPIQITHHNDQRRELNKVRVDKVDFSLSNGAKRSGYLIQPVGSSFPPKDIPMVTWQQGGPIATMTQEWGTMVEQPFNLLPNFGIALLVTPLPGRDGFGPEFLQKLVDGDNFGQIDIDEQVEIIDQMVKYGYTSWSQTGITGCSYGGYFTAQSITNHSSYAAANPQCSLIDLFNEWETGYKSFIAYLMGSSPTNLEEYTLDSPLQNADRVETPTLIFAGTKDFLPSELSRKFHDDIEATGTPVSYYEFIGEGHGLYHPTSQFVAAQAQLEWFRYFLQP